MVVRDFKEWKKSGHEDFENKNAGEKGIVKDQLGRDYKPVYAKEGKNSASTSGKTNFDRWFNNVPGNFAYSSILVISIYIVHVRFDTIWDKVINKKIELTLTSVNPLRYSYDNQSFFLIDGEGWGNQNRNHNFGYVIHSSRILNYYWN